MLLQLIAFLVCLALGLAYGACYRLVLLLEKRLGFCALFDVLFVGACTIVSGIFMIWFIHRVAFFAFSAIVVGVVISSVVLFPKKPPPNEQVDGG